MNLNAVAFLRAVLPDGGWYAAWTKIGDRKYNTFFATIEELAAHIALEDAQGKTVYHACASFREVGRRTQDNVWGAKSLWLDIDGGENAVRKGTGYVDIQTGLNALFEFSAAAEIPDPLYVISGSGVHSYWPLTRSIHPADWRQRAEALRGATRRFGLLNDPSRVADLASVLRTPGTYNRKTNPPVLVQGTELVGPYDVELFDHLLEYRSAGAGSRNDPVRTVADRQNIVSPLTQALIVEPDYAPVYSDNVADNCAQLELLRVSKGNVLEPLWYAALGVLSRCTDGQAKAHEWSAGHPQYSYEETQAKFDRTLALTGATTCAKFESVNYAGCQQCPLRGQILSPISAGTIRSISAELQIQNAAPQPHVAPADGGSQTLPMLPDPFAWSNTSQLVIRTEKPDGAASTALVSQFPIFLAGIGVGEVRNDRFSLQFRQWLPHRGWFDIYVAAGKLFGQGGGAELAERGANIHDHKTFLHYIRLASDAFHAREKLKMQYDQCGWKEGYDGFLVGDALYTHEGVHEHVTVSPELHTRAQWLGPQAGTLEGWSGAANALFAAGCEAQSFALACAFAAPLMRLQATDEGGAVVNLLSRGSGTGKTTALSAVYTAWGKKQGLSLTKIDTRVAKAISLGVLGNMPAVYDELHDRDPQVIREFIMMFTEGRDKMRGNADGSITHTQASWQTLMVTSSNISIHDILAHTGGSDALAYRVLEFNCQLPEGVVAAKGDQLRKDMEANAGWAGDAYIDYLLQPGVMSEVQRMLTAWTAELWEKAGNRPEHRFWMRTIGAVAVAGTLANNIGILHFAPQRIIEWAMSKLTLQTSITREGDGLARSVGTFGEFLSSNIDTVLVVRSAFKQGQRTKEHPLTVPRRAVYMRYELEGRRLFIQDKIFRQWLLEREVGTRELLDDLERIQLVTTRRRGITLTAGTDIVGAQMPCIEIDGNHPAISGIIANVPVAAMQQDNQQALA